MVSSVEVGMDVRAYTSILRVWNCEKGSVWEWRGGGRLTFMA